MTPGPERRASSPDDLLVGISDGDASERLTALRRRLADRARDGHLLEVAYRVVASPVGDLIVAATPSGLACVAFVEVRAVDDILADLATQVGPRLLEAPAHLDDPARQLDEYFRGRRRHFDLPLDLALATGFRREVLAALPTIAPGTTASYGELAARVGRPRAARAVGTACATNPLPIVLPCHRVVRADGSMGRYAGGVRVKYALLSLEGVAMPDPGPG